MFTEMQPLLAVIEKNERNYDLEKIKKAFLYAKELHAGQFRLSGEPYVCHPVAVAEIAAQLGLEYLEILDRTLPFIDGEYLERDSTIRGELYRTLLPRLMSENAEEKHLAVRALRIALAAIDGKRIFEASDREGGRS